MINKFAQLIGMILILTFYNSSSFANSKTNQIEIFYSRQISYNLNHIMNITKNLYQLTDETTFRKKHLEHELTLLEHEINVTNKNISELINYIPNSKSRMIRSNFDSIDEHIAQAHVDINSLREGLNNNSSINIPGLISDIYNQIKETENVDHAAIKRLQNYIDDNLTEIPKIER
jgi:hypothetical protein